MVTNEFCPVIISGDDLTSVILFMGKICSMNRTAGNKVSYTRKGLRQTGMKSFYGTADYPALIHPPWFYNV